ncbi:MAG: sulfotransferase family 2 domain-containing protein [Pseudomonadota bacterium]
MAAQFDYFVIFAEMRTGSNLLEASLNAHPGLRCEGEAFNPHFVGYPKTDQVSGITRAARDADPQRLLEAIRKTPDALGGFRYFHDHDPRILETMLNDDRCAKVVLTRNPVDSYVSLKIAKATGQWKLTNVKHRKAARVMFDAAEFETYLSTLREFQRDIHRRLQISGQSAFFIDYSDLRSPDVLGGLVRFLGIDGPLPTSDVPLKPQNPGALQDKVINLDEMQRALGEFDTFDLNRLPVFEPQRGPSVPGFVTGAHAGLLYMPIKSGPDHVVRSWLAELDGVDVTQLASPRNQKALRQWKRRKIGHRSFTVLRHPVARAHAAFCDKILNTGPGSFAEIRKTLRTAFKVPLPGRVDEQYGPDSHRMAFLGFLDFLKQNLTGQTNIRVDAHWATQAAVLQGMANFGVPDQVLREEEMIEALPELARNQGYKAPPHPGSDPATGPVSLSAIYDADLERRVADIYQRDYMMFGFGSWSGASDQAA